MNNRHEADPIENEIVLLGGITDRKLGLLRLILAAAALLIIFIDPTEPDRYVTLTYFSLVTIAIYSLFVYIAAIQRTNFSSRILTCLIWVDIAWATAMISMSSGTASVFYFFYMFEIIVACSRGSRKLGMAVTIVSSILCVSVGLLTSPPAVFELNRFLLRPLAILALGYTLTYWGGTELALKKKLILLKELSTVANPRFGVDRTIDRMLGQILNFYAADHCVLILDLANESQLYRATGPNVSSGIPISHSDNAIRQFLTETSSSCADVFNSRNSANNSRATFKRYDPRANRVISLDIAAVKPLTDVLGADSLVAATSHYREHLRGRLLVSCRRPNAFEIGDGAFLLQAMNQVLPLIENIRLVDRLASDASEAERQRIARSVHDRVIQPYYGLQIGLKALQGILESEGKSRSDLSGPIQSSGKPELLLEQLMNMTTEGINELREYVYGLKQAPASATRLEDSIRRFAGKFEGATGIRVDVSGENEGFAANDRLTAEVFQMTAEALSNIHRHTHARSAQVKLNLQSNNLILQVENETGSVAEPIHFSPGSISERADALGGSTEVLWAEGRTILRVAVPL
jgi:signal transduction histidine kinase